MSESEQRDSIRGEQLKIGVLCYMCLLLGLARISERGVPFHLRKIKLIVPIQLECTVTFIFRACQLLKYTVY